MKRLIGLITLAIIIMLAGCSPTKAVEAVKPDLSKTAQGMSQSTQQTGQKVNDENYFTRAG